MPRRFGRVLGGKRKATRFAITAGVASIVGVILTVILGLPAWFHDSGFGDADRAKLHASLEKSDAILEAIAGSNEACEIGDLLEARVSETFGYTRVGFERELGMEMASGRKFYSRHLKQPFPDLPGTFFVTLVRIRARESQAPGTQIEIQLESPAIAVFWNYADYCDLCTHGRDFVPPRYTFFVDPVYATRWFDVFILTALPINVPTVNVCNWIR